MLSRKWGIAVLTLADDAYSVLDRTPPKWMTQSVRNVAVISAQQATPSISPVMTTGTAT
jgi:hypothetical protein